MGLYWTAGARHSITTFPTTACIETARQLPTWCLWPSVDATVRCRRRHLWFDVEVQHILASPERLVERASWCVDGIGLDIDDVRADLACDLLEPVDEPVAIPRLLCGSATARS